SVRRQSYRVQDHDRALLCTWEPVMATRPTQQDVLTALLAFDSYNRGDNPQIGNKDGSQLATAIGTATWVRVSDDLAGAVAVGFSASQYNMLGTTVISYRGTD